MHTLRYLVCGLPLIAALTMASFTSIHAYVWTGSGVALKNSMHVCEGAGAGPGRAAFQLRLMGDVLPAQLPRIRHGHGLTGSRLPAPGGKPVVP